MKKTLFYLLLMLFLASSLNAVETSSIEAIRRNSKDSGSKLSESDISQISGFWDAALDEMLLADTSVGMVDVRRQLEGLKGEDNLSYYSDAYAAQAAKSIEAAFKDSDRFDDEKQKELVQRNLMILMGNLESLKLVPLALEHFGAKDVVIRYWAFKAVTQPAVIQQLISGVTADEALVLRILDAFKEHIDTESQSEIISRAVNFCVVIDNARAREILQQVKDIRVKTYQNWTVIDCSVDVRLLTALGNIAAAQADAKIKSDFGRMFSELFALVMQRYILDFEDDPDGILDQLGNVIVMIDQGVLEKVMGIRTGILQAMKSRNITITNLKREYETLFGDRRRSGQLGTMFQFSYGTDDTGKPITSPPVLPPRPVKEKSES